MIPIRLKMHNFMCYRDNVPPLHFEGIHLACLSGDNGNGKSALIDALTWALWSQARAKSDDDLISSGQSEMEVELEFAVGQQSYRIVRKRSKPKRQGGSGQTILEFQIDTGDSFQSITGNSVAQTQQKITDTLHMDYHTFINSAFLRQGHADEFTNQAPVRRKEVLVNILDLSLYDDLEDQAKEMGRQQEKEKDQQENTVRGIINELAQKTSYNTQLEQIKDELSHIERSISEKEARLNELQETKASMGKKKVQLEQVEMHLSSTRKDLEIWNEQISQHHSKINKYEKLMAQRPAIEDGYTRFVETRKFTQEQDGRLRKLAGLKEKKYDLEMAISTASQELLKERALTQNKIKGLQARTQQLPELKNRLNHAQAQLRTLAKQEESLQRKKRVVQKLQTQLNHLEANQTRLEREISELGEKLDLLSTQTEANCPLCETELGFEGLKLIKSKYTTDRQATSDSLKANQAELAQKKTEFNALNNELSQLEPRLNKERTAAQSDINILMKDIADSEEAEKLLVEERRILAETERHLAMKNFATVEQEALSAIEEDLASIGYDSQQHEQAQHLLVELEEYDHAKRQLDGADELISQAKESLARTEEASTNLRQGLETEKQKQQALTSELVPFPEVLNNLTRAETENQELTKHRTRLQETLWSVKAKLQRFAELETKKKERASLSAKALKEETIYKELAEAFGKRGIQALLIEMALPEIETEANRLLGRMTDNRMHVKFETQRETKKGDMAETLDINIADELGTRNYEMFSGGEAFRIDLAIRIALSKLLARRAGAPLPTLIIDEGFGTQDSTGIEKLKEAINSIQDDFEKIIIITHIEELRDAFDTRIDIIKNADGFSTLSVS